MSRFHTPVTPELADYIRAVTVREPEPLRRLREETEDHPQASCQIAVEQAQFLHMLLLAMGARNAIEIGVFLGYSSSWLALALPENGRLVACDFNEEYAERARTTWRECKVERRIELRLAPALTTLDELLQAGEAGQFDFVLIDADKQGYIDYYERSLNLVRRGGVIAADNALWKGTVSDAGSDDPETKGIREFNLHVSRDPRVASAIVTTGDGLMLACKL
jgi:predicted O-methyltransferase YrrM